MTPRWQIRGAVFEEQCLLMCFRVSMYTRCLCIDDGATKKNKYYTRQHTMPEKYRDTSGIRKFFRHVHVGVAFHTATRTFFPSLAVRNIYKICFALRLSKLTIPKRSEKKNDWTRAISSFCLQTLTWRSASWLHFARTPWSRKPAITNFAAYHR